MFLSIATKQNLVYLFLMSICTIVTVLLYYHTHQEWILFRDAETLYHKKQYKSASELYETVLKTGFFAPKLKLHLADSLVAIGNFKDAISLYRELLKENPTDTQIRLALARALSWSGNVEGAEEEYHQLLETK